MQRAEYGIWRGFQAAHIFPLAYEGHWVQYGQVWRLASGSINFFQNGLMLENTIHEPFNGYDISINSDEVLKPCGHEVMFTHCSWDNYKIVCFAPVGKDIAGQHLDQQLLQDPTRPVVTFQTSSGCRF